MMSRRLALGVGTLALAGVFLASLAGPVASQAPRTGGTLVVAAASDPAHLMGLNQNRDIQYVSGQLFPALLEYGLDLKPRSSLAETWTASPDGTTYTFRLVKNAKWTDGKPITSADVKFSFQEMIIPFHPSGRANFEVVATIDTPDPGTVVFRLKEPFGPFLTLLGAMTGMILPEHVYKGSNPFDNRNSTTAAVTGGPFVLKEWVKGDHLTLARNPNFFKPGRPYVDQIVFKFIPDPSARVLALQSGAVDYVLPGVLPLNAIDNLKKQSGVTVAPRGAEATGDVQTFGFNLRRKPFDDVRVRQAISHAINKDFIAQAVGFGHALKANGPLHPTSWAFDPGLQVYPYDPEKAKRLLDEAGYRVKPDGFRFAMELTTRPALYVYAKANEIMADNLKAIGIDAKLRPLDAAAYIPATFQKWDFDMSGVLWISAFDPHNLSGLYTCRNVKPVPFANFTGYCSAAVDELLAQAVRARTPDERKALYQKVQQQIVADAPALWVMGNIDWVAYRNVVQGVPPGPWDGRDPLDGVWLSGQ